MSKIRTRSLVVPLALCILAAGAASSSRASFAAVVATGTLRVECGVDACCASVAFANQTFDVFGTPVNLGSSVGAMISIDTAVTGTPTGGTFDGSLASHPDGSLLSFHGAGDYVCSGIPNACVSPYSFIGSLGSIAGSVGLPAGNTYVEDGTVSTTASNVPSTIPGCPLSPVLVHEGSYAINAFQPVSTPSGSNVTSTLSSTFLDSGTGTSVAVTTDVTYSNVSAAGETTLTTVSNAAGAIDSRFAVDVASCSGSAQPCSTDYECPSGETCDGYHAAFFDISTTATFSGPVTVCGHYPDDEPSPPGGDGIVDGTTVSETGLRILHKPAGSNDFVDVTTSRDTAANVVCGEVTSFSPFVIAVHSSCANQSGTFAGRPILKLTKINSDAAANNDGLLIKGRFTLPVGTSFAALDPKTDGARVILANRHNLERVTIAVPAGEFAGKGTRGWKLNSAGNKWTFFEQSDTPANGIVKMIVRDDSKSAAGMVRVTVKGKNGTYPIVAGDEPLRATIVFGSDAAAAAGKCGESDFAANECAFNGTGNKLTCK